MFYIIMNSEAEFKYWCYSCQKHFQQTVLAQSCQFCHSPAIELVENNTGEPSNFQVYEIAGSRVQSQPPPTNSNVGAPPQFLPFPFLNMNPFQFAFSTGVVNNPNQPQAMQMTLNIGNMMQTVQTIVQRSGMSQLFNSLLGEPNLVPASVQDISRLEQIDRVKECSICQQQQIEKKGYKLQCGHDFHVDCLTPWLQRTNTCPTCRQRI